MIKERKGLGRGLSALISPTSVSVIGKSYGGDGNAALKEDVQLNVNIGDNIKFVSVNSLVPNPKQPRVEFSESEILELKESIQSLGILQPILVRRGKGDTYEIVAGERRWRAASVAGLQQVPIIEKSLSDLETLQIGLVENIQRSQLSALEEARGYERLINEYGLTQDQVAEMIGKNRASVANYLRLLKLSDDVLELLKAEKISMGHAKVILTVKEPAVQSNLAKKVVEEGLSVRALEQLVGTVLNLEKPTRNKKERAPNFGSQSSNLTELTDRLRQALGTRVTLSENTEGKGKIIIDYFSNEELGRIIDKICL